MLGGRKCCLSNRRTLKDIRDRRFRTCQASDMLASHHRSAIPGLVFKLLNELQRSISIPTITSAKERPRHPAGRKQTVPALASEPTRSAAHSDSHLSLISECHFFVTVWVRARRPATASFAVAQSLAAHEHPTVIVTFSASTIVVGWPCVQIAPRAGASALGLSASQVACHPSPTRAWEGQFPAWLRAALGWNTNAQGDTTWCGRFVWRGWLAPACCCHR